MKLKKAIELSIEAEKSLRNGNFPDHADAVRLGYRAMARLGNIRGIDPSRPIDRLAGEDKG